jgi:hypothetical protein
MIRTFFKLESITPKIIYAHLAIIKKSLATDTFLLEKAEFQILTHFLGRFKAAPHHPKRGLSTMTGSTSALSQSSKRVACLRQLFDW